ncbi:SH3 domain protein [Rhodotorula toruloides]|nr:SH3 domain protein [Rhodotorula toruloides]
MDTTAVVGEPLAATTLVAAPQDPAAETTTAARAVASARTTTPAAAAAPTVTSRIIQGHTTTTTPARVTTTAAAARTTTTTSAAAQTTQSTAARVASLSSSHSSSAPSSSSTSSSSNSSSSGISGGAAAGIVIAILAVLALLGGVFIYRRRKASRSRGSGQALFDQQSPDVSGGWKKERETVGSEGVWGGGSASPTAWGGENEGEKEYYAGGGGGYGATQQAQNPFNNPPTAQYGAIPPQQQQPYPLQAMQQQQQGWPQQQSTVNLLAPAAASFAAPAAVDSIEQREMQQELENRAQLAAAQSQAQAQSSPFAESEGQGEIRLVKGTFDPSLDDELVLYAGDAVQVLMKYDDGWALGLNLNSGRPPAKGVFPFDCLGEVCPPPAASAVRVNGQPPQAQQQAQRALSPSVPSALQPGSPQPAPLAPINPALVPLPPPTPTSLEPIAESEGVKSGPPQLAPLALTSSDSPLSASFPPSVQSIPAPTNGGGAGVGGGQMKRASSLIASRDADLFVALGEVIDKEGQKEEKKEEGHVVVVAVEAEGGEGDCLLVTAAAALASATGRLARHSALVLALLLALVVTSLTRPPSLGARTPISTSGDDCPTARATITTANLSLLSSLFHTLYSDLQPVLPTLSSLQTETILTNSTFLSTNLAQLGSITAQIPPADTASASPADLVGIIEIGTTRYDILTFWAPEVWSIVIVYGIAAVLKGVLGVMMGRRAVRRAKEAIERREGEGKGGRVDGEVVKALLASPARAALGHALNATVATIALVLQCIAWRLFVLPSSPVRMSDIKYLSTAMKTLLIGYGCDMLFSDLRPEIFLHHFFTFALLLVGQLAAFETKSPKFFRLAQYLILQATAEQTTYGGMVAYHLSKYYAVQDWRPRLQRSLLVTAHKLLVFTTWIAWPQKILPAAFALYWLGRMWNEIDHLPWGRAWIVVCTVILSLLLTLQIKFCDDAIPLANYIGYKLYGGPFPSRVGPVMRILTLPFRRPHRERTPSTLPLSTIVPSSSAPSEFSSTLKARSMEEGKMEQFNLPVLERESTKEERRSSTASRASVASSASSIAETLPGPSSIDTASISEVRPVSLDVRRPPLFDLADALRRPVSH